MFRLASVTSVLLSTQIKNPGPSTKPPDPGFMGFKGVLRENHSLDWSSSPNYDFQSQLVFHTKHIYEIDG